MHLIKKNFLYSKKIRDKLADKHQVTEDEIFQCFLNNLSGKALEDNREDHKSDPPTRWFIAKTDKNRDLKVAFIISEGKICIKTAYEPNDAEKRIYSNKTK